MKLYPIETSSTIRPEVLRSKHMFGIWFGVALGLAFAIFAWGFDSFLLSRMNGLYPWLKFLGGAIPCVVVGGLTGWLAARLDKPVVAMLLWAAAASVFAWLTISLPLLITPSILNLVESGINDLLHYTYYEALSSRFSLTYVWVAIFVAIAGLLQIPLSDSAVFSTTFFGRISPILVTFVLMAICGMTVDGFNNELLRSSVDEVNTTIQFVLDHRGMEITPADSRRMRLSALRNIEGLISPDPQYIVSGHDLVFEQVQVLARFEKGWVECELILNQIVNCEQVGTPR